MKPPPLQWRTKLLMLLIYCPYCGPRPEIEFVYGGQAHIVRTSTPETESDESWGNFLYFRDNVKGAHAERWRHTHGCARFFNAIRDTTTDQFVTTYRVGERPYE
jgi:sarcosine oxidase subunit delta